MTLEQPFLHLHARHTQAFFFRGLSISLLQELKRFLKKPIHNITDSDNLSNLRRNLYKKPQDDTLIC